MDAADRVKQNNYIVTKLTKIEEKKDGLLNMEIGGNKIKPKPFSLMCSQFAIILNSGVPIGRTVHLIAEKTTDKPLKKILLSVAEDVEAGRSLAASFEERGGDKLPSTFIETIRAGEESGNLDKSFLSMHEHYDKQIKIRGKIKGALAYPAFVLVIAIAVIVVLMVKVVPVFTQMFNDIGGEMPLPTRMLIGMSEFFIHRYPFIIGIIVLIVAVYKIYGNTEDGRMNFAKIALKLPIFGNINILTAASEFSNTMATMLEAGLPLTRGLSITAKTMSNYYISTETGKLTGKIEEGHELSASMREAGIMPDILIDMVGVGEETGELAGTLNTIAKYYDAELDVATTAAVSKLEPAILVGLAAFAGFIVIAIYMAMFGMYAAM
jgi:type IV pilus assembly protein PilC